MTMMTTMEMSPIYSTILIVIAGGSTCTASGSTSSGVYLRGPSQLPARPIPLHRRPVIRPSGDKYYFTTISYDMLNIELETNHS